MLSAMRSPADTSAKSVLSFRAPPVASATARGSSSARAVQSSRRCHKDLQLARNRHSIDAHVTYGITHGIKLTREPASTNDNFGETIHEGPKARDTLCLCFCNGTHGTGHHAQPRILAGTATQRVQLGWQGTADRHGR